MYLFPTCFAYFWVHVSNLVPTCLSNFAAGAAGASAGAGAAGAASVAGAVGAAGQVNVM